MPLYIQIFLYSNYILSHRISVGEKSKVTSGTGIGNFQRQTGVHAGELCQHVS